MARLRRWRRPLLLIIEPRFSANPTPGRTWLAAAVGWSSGSLAPPGYDVVEPGPWLTSEACYAALMQQAVREPEQITARLVSWTKSACDRFGGPPRSAGS